MQAKVCSKCSTEKSLEMFSKPNLTYCKRCTAALCKAHRHKHRAAFLLARGPLPVVTEKVCRACKAMKPLGDYHLHTKKNGLSNRASYCKPCCVILAARRRDANPDGRKAEMLRYKTKAFGTTPEWFTETLLKQKGVCAICGHPEPDRYKKTGKLKSLAIDHDHETGKVRGLLCTKCNQSLFLLEKHKGWAERAVEYLSRFSGDIDVPQ